MAILALSACGDDDGMIMDAGPAGDAGAVDAGAVDSGPVETDAGPATGTVRYRMLEVAELTNSCECAVSDGDYADQEACIAANPDEVSTEAELTCAQGVLDGAPEADRAIYECYLDGFRTFVDCTGALSCADRGSSPPSAGEIECSEADDAAFEACGTPTVDQAFDDCFD